MSECRICREHGFPGIMIAWDNNIKTKNGRFVPLELDKTTPHKHYESATANNDKNDNNDNDTSPSSKTTTKPDLGNLDLIKVIAAALNEYLAIKEEGRTRIPITAFTGYVRSISMRQELNRLTSVYLKIVAIPFKKIDVS